MAEYYSLNNFEFVFLHPTLIFLPIEAIGPGKNCGKIMPFKLNLRWLPEENQQVSQVIHYVDLHVI